MRAVVLAYHEMGCVGIERLLANGFEIAAVFTHADRAGEQLWFRSVAEVSAGHGLPVFAPEDINHPLSVERIRALKPDILFSFYYRELIGPALLDVPPAGCLNMHGSLLPRYRGCAPANWAILNGETETGVTLHYMTTAPDAGDIVCQHTVPITREDDGRSLNLKLAVAAGPMLDEYLPAVRSGSAPRVPQRHDEATYFGRRSPDDGEIDWATSAADIENLARAVTRPYAGAFTYSPSQRVMIWKASARQDDAGREPGTIVSVRPLEVACGSGTLRVDFAQRAGGVYCRGEQLAADMNLVVGLKFGEAPESRARKPKTRVLILGVNGFIGNFLSERLLEDGGYEVHGMDLHDSAIDVLSPNRVSVRADSPGVMNKEIGFAAAAGLTCWAFDYYHPRGFAGASRFNEGLRQYLSSPCRGEINFSLVLQGRWLGPPVEWSATVSTGDVPIVVEI